MANQGPTKIWSLQVHFHFQQHFFEQEAIVPFYSKRSTVPLVPLARIAYLHNQLVTSSWLKSRIGDILYLDIKSCQRFLDALASLDSKL